MHRRHLDATSPVIPMSRHRGDRLQSKDDDDMTNLLSPGVKLLPNLVTRIGENFKQTFGNLNLTIFPVNTATWCIFARCCMWASFQMSRSFDTCTRGCQCFSVALAVVSEMSRIENQLFCDQGRFSSERWADGEWNNHVMHEEPVEIMLTGKVRVFSDSGLLDDTTASLFWEKQQRQS